MGVYGCPDGTTPISAPFGSFSLMCFSQLPQQIGSIFPVNVFAFLKVIFECNTLGIPDFVHFFKKGAGINFQRPVFHLRAYKISSE